jgi:hypothetical protein
MAETNPLKRCPNCLHENAVEAVRCEQCGELIERQYRTTLEVPEVTDEQSHDTAQIDKLGDSFSLLADAVAFFVHGEARPLVVKSKDQIILGRRAPDAPAPAADFSEFHAYEMGLSRRHAMVVRADNGYALVDLGSTNGTWLNDMRLMPNRLYPLHNGDQIRLGRLALSIYFYSAPVGTVNEADSSESRP